MKENNTPLFLRCKKIGYALHQDGAQKAVDGYFGIKEKKEFKLKRSFALRIAP